MLYYAQGISICESCKQNFDWSRYMTSSHDLNLFPSISNSASAGFSVCRFQNDLERSISRVSSKLARTWSFHGQRSRYVQ